MKQTLSGLVCLIAFSASAVAQTPIANGTYVVMNSANLLAWDDLYSYKTAGTKVSLWPWTGGPNERWTFTSIGSGYYTIQDQTSGLMLDDPNASTVSGTQLIQWPSNGARHQHWLIASAGSGLYTVKNQASGMLVDAASNTKGTYIVQKTANGSSAQKWSIRKNAVTLSPSSLTFASETVGTTSAAQTTTLSNASNTLLSISSIGLTGTNAGDFGYNTACGSSVAASAKCAINVTFSPQVSGTRTATLQVFDNAQGSPQLVSLSGSAQAATAPAVSISPATLSFPDTTVSSTSGALYSTITNTGTANLIFSSPFVVSGPGFAFGGSGTCAVNTAYGPGSSCTVGIVFQPDTSGTETGSVTVSDNAANSPQIIALTGTGIADASTHTVTATWTLSTTSDVTSQKVYRCTGAGCIPGTVVGTVDAFTSSFTDSTGVNGTTYVYAATAVDASGESVQSNTATAVVPST